MANCVIYKFTSKEHEEVTLKLDNARAQELEQRFDDSLLTKMHEISKLSIATEYIAAAITDATKYEIRKEIAGQIFDDMIDSGKTIEDYHKLVYDVLVSAGFLKAADVERTLQTAAATEKLQEMTFKAGIKDIENRMTEIATESGLTLPTN